MPSIAKKHTSGRFCPILGIVEQIKSHDKPVINFSIGVPNFVPDQNIYVNGITAIQNDVCRYGDSKGDSALINAYLTYLEESGFDQYEYANIVAGMGGKHLLDIVFSCLLDEGSNIVIPTPCWPTYFDIANVHGIKVNRVDTRIEQHFKMTAKQLESAIDDSTQAVLLNSPNNPTGAVYSEAELIEIAQVLERHDVWVICDDVYSRYVYDMTSEPKISHHLLNVSKQLNEKIIKIDSVSKLYGMPGWRIGMLAAPILVADAVAKCISNSISNLSPASSAMAAEAFEGDQTYSYNAVESLKSKRDRLYNTLNDLDLVECLLPEGAFYFFPDVSRCYGLWYGNDQIRNDLDFCRVLLQEHSVAIVPGRYFGNDRCVRLSYAIDDDAITEGIKRITTFIGSLTHGPGQSQAQNRHLSLLETE